MTLRTKGEQETYLDDFERCAECIKKYLSDKGKNILECQLMAVRNAIEIEDIEPQESEGQRMNYKSFNLGDWIGHISGVIEDESELDGNEMRDLVEFLSGLPKTGHCKDCKWWKDNDGVYRRGVGAESKCPINRKEVYEGNGYCFLFEPQESEDKE